MMRQVNLNALTQGIQRLREKGSPDPQSLYDLVNGYVAIDGSVRQRPGTVHVADLPSDTHGLIAHRGDLVVFATSPRTMPAGFRCEVVTHPHDADIGISRVWFAAPFLGFIYAVVEFLDGSIYHYWQQDGIEWEPNKMYVEGTVIVPANGNGMAYKAVRTSPPFPNWEANAARAIGDKVEPANGNGYYYEVTAVGGDTPRSGTVEPVWPAESDAVVVEFADNQKATQSTGSSSSGDGYTGSVGGATGGRYDTNPNQSNTSEQER